ncbi:MAG: sulfate ABC transporter permease subunit CysW [Thermoguttaceae bacterium]
MASPAQAAMRLFPGGATSRSATREPALVRGLLIGTAVAFLGLFLVVPLVAVFYQALVRGVAAYFAALTHPDARAAIGLSLWITAIAVSLNTVFGVSAAWAIGKFEFAGKQLLVTLIDLPYSISPVIAGLVFVLVFGQIGWFGSWLEAHGMKVIYAVPGMVLATLFVTLPFVVRGLIPLMEAQGTEQEEAARVLGASGWQIFWRVTLPNIRWGLLYGVILTIGRAMGEFGAVAVVSGRIRGKTNTMPLYVEILYNQWNLSGAFAVASVLAGLALATLAAKAALQWRVAAQLARAGQSSPQGNLP